MTSRRMTRRASALTLALAGSLVTLTAAVAIHENPTGWDLGLLLTLRTHRTPALTALARTVTTLGSPAVTSAVVLLLTALLALRRRRLRPLTQAVVVLGCCELAVRLLKFAVDRPRPALELRVPDVSAGGLAFVSGHAALSAAGCTLLVLALIDADRSTPTPRRASLVVVTAVIVVAVGWSRVYLGVHWPSDVLGGWLVGLLTVTSVAGAGPPNHRHAVRPEQPASARTLCRPGDGHTPGRTDRRATQEDDT